jgi:hypothetical protein
MKTYKRYPNLDSTKVKTTVERLQNIVNNNRCRNFKEIIDIYKISHSDNLNLVTNSHLLSFLKKNNILYTEGSGKTKFYKWNLCMPVDDLLISNVMVSLKEITKTHNPKVIIDSKTITDEKSIKPKKTISIFWGLLTINL